MTNSIILKHIIRDIERKYPFAKNVWILSWDNYLDVDYIQNQYIEHLKFKKNELLPWLHGGDGVSKPKTIDSIVKVIVEYKKIFGLSAKELIPIISEAYLQIKIRRLNTISNILPDVIKEKLELMVINLNKNQ